MAKGSSTVPVGVVSAAAAPAAAAPIPLEAIHDAAQQARNLRQVLQDDKQRIGCFLGAGCPLGVYTEDGKKSAVLVPAVIELTKRVAAGLQERDLRPGATSQYRKQWDALAAECKLASIEPTVEDVLTEIRTLANRRGTAEILGMTKSALTELDERVCDLCQGRLDVRAA